MISFPASLTFISDEVSQDPRVVVAFARRHGFNGIELRSIFGRAFRDLTPNDVSELAGILADAGLQVVGCSTPVFKCQLDDAAQRREHVEIFRRSVDVGVALGAPLLRVFTFLRGSGAPTGAELARAAEEITPLLEFCPAGMRIGIENEASCLMATGEETQRLLRSATDPRLTVVWDPCNVLYVPGYSGTATEGFGQIAARVGHIHMKDAVRTPHGAEARKLGDGEVGWRKHLGEIARSGYDGRLSLETHWRMKALDAAALHLPAGFGFSAGGEAASEACVEVMREMLKS